MRSPLPVLPNRHRRNNRQGQPKDLPFSQNEPVSLQRVAARSQQLAVRSFPIWAICLCCQIVVESEDHCGRVKNEATDQEFLVLPGSGLVICCCWRSVWRRHCRVISAARLQSFWPEDGQSCEVRGGSRRDFGASSSVQARWCLGSQSQPSPIGSAPTASENIAGPNRALRQAARSSASVA